MKTQKWKRFLSGFLAAALLAGGMITPVTAAQAASIHLEVKQDETDNPDVPDMTDEEMAEFLKGYASADAEQNDQIFEELALKALNHLIIKAGQKIEDKAFDKVFEIFFGGNENAEILNQLGEINGKLDRIASMVDKIIAMLENQDYKNSMKEKQDDYRTLATNTRAVMREFEHSKDDEIRWGTLQTWYKLTLGKHQNSLISFENLCDRLTNVDHMNTPDMNYVQQYEAYGKYLYDWDMERYAFTESQKQRDFYYLISMTSMNLLYLQYAESHKIQGINFASQRQAIQDHLKDVIKCYENTPVNVPKEDNMIVQFDKKEFVISRSTSVYAAETFEHMIRRYINDEKFVNKTLDEFEEAINSGRPGNGYHLMSNAERDAFIKRAKEKGLSLAEYISLGTYDNDAARNYKYITTSIDQGKSKVFHYKEYSGLNYPIYFENYDWTAQNGYLNTEAAKASLVSHYGVFRFTSIWGSFRQSRFNECIYSRDDRLGDFVYHDHLCLWVKDNAACTLEDDYQEPTENYAEGTITDIQAMEDGRSSITLQTKDGNLQMISDKYLDTDTELAVGQEVAVKYQQDKYNNYASIVRKDMETLMTYEKEAYASEEPDKESADNTSDSAEDQVTENNDLR